MQMENFDQNATLAAVTHYAVQSHEAAEDFLLPDYMPAIRRVLSVRAMPLPESRFLTGKALEFGGTLAYSVLYIGEGGEIFCAPLTSEYNASASLAENAVADAASVGVDTAAENVTCRVTAPRRLTLKCRLKTKITALSPHPIGATVSDAAGGRVTPADEIALERLVLEADDVTLSRGELTATVGGALSAAGKVVSCSGAVHVEDAAAGADSVTVRGNVILNVISLSPDGVYSPMTVKTPFSETVTVPGAAAGDQARAWGRAASVNVTSAENESTWEIEFDLEAESARAEKRPYTADAFSTLCEADVAFAETDSMSLLRFGQGAITVSGETGRQSKSVQGDTVLDTYAVCTPERVEIDGGRLILTGTCAVTALILAEGDVACEEFSLPFKYECEAAMPSVPDLLWRCSAETASASVRADGDKLSAHVDASFSLCVIGRDKIRFAEGITLAKAARRTAEDGYIRICYPEIDEPLWEIAKRYGVSRQTIRMQNGLPETVLTADGAPILI